MMKIARISALIMLIILLLVGCAPKQEESSVVETQAVNLHQDTPQGVTYQNEFNDDSFFSVTAVDTAGCTDDFYAVGARIVYDTNAPTIGGFPSVKEICDEGESDPVEIVSGISIGWNASNQAILYVNPSLWSEVE